MAVFQPDDLLEAALRKLAIELGVPEMGRTKTQIVQDIQREHPNVSLLSVPIVAAPPTTAHAKRDWVGTVAVIATALTALFTVMIAWANLKSADASQTIVMQTAGDKEDDKKTSWQTHKVYEIIDDAGREGQDFKGLSFDQIMTHYRSAAQDPEMAVKIGKEEIKPFSLRKILTELQGSQLIYKTWDNNYIAQRASVNTRADNTRMQMANKTVFEILKVLKEKSGKITYAGLESEITRQVKGLSDEDFLFAMNQMASQSLITIDDNRFVWSALHPPPKK